MAESTVACRESEEVSKFGEGFRIKLEKLKSEVEDMGSLGLWWDSMLSEDEKRQYLYIFSLKSTDKEYVINEIQKYSELYMKIETISSQSFDEIEKLYDEMKEMVELAKEEIKVTTSKKVYALHKSLISSGIEGRVEMVKNAVGTNEFRKLRGNIDNIIKKEAEELGKEYREENAKLKTENENVRLEKEKIEETHRVKLQKLKEESQKRIQEVEERLNESRKLVEEMENKLVGETEMRLNMEEKLRNESLIKANEIEEKLRLESQTRAKEMEERFAEKIKEIGKMKENYKRLIEEKKKASENKSLSESQTLSTEERAAQSRSQSLSDLSSNKKSENPKPTPGFKIFEILEN